MTTITVMFDMPEVTAAQNDRDIQGLEAAGEGHPKGRLFHVAFPKGEGWLVVDVWESGELLDRFAQTLIPIMQKAGVTPPRPQVYPVHSMIK